MATASLLVVAAIALMGAEAPQPRERPDPAPAFTTVVPDASGMIFVAGGEGTDRAIRDSIDGLIDAEVLDRELGMGPGGRSYALTAGMIISQGTAGLSRLIEIDPTLEFVAIVTRGHPAEPGSSMILFLPRPPGDLGEPLAGSLAREGLEAADLPEAFRAPADHPDPFPLTPVSPGPVAPADAESTLATLSVAAWAALCQERGYEAAMLADAGQMLDQAGVDPESLPEAQRDQMPEMFAAARAARRLGMALDADAGEIHMWLDFDERRGAVAFLNAWGDFVRDAQAGRVGTAPLPDALRSALGHVPRGRADIERVDGLHSALIRFEIDELQPFVSRAFVAAFKGAAAEQSSRP